MKEKKENTWYTIQIWQYTDLVLLFFLDREEIIIVRDFNFKKNMGCCVYKGTYGRGTFKVYPMISDYLRNVKELIEEVLCEKKQE